MVYTYMTCPPLVIGRLFAKCFFQSKMPSLFRYFSLKAATGNQFIRGWGSVWHRADLAAWNWVFHLNTCWLEILGVLVLKHKISRIRAWVTWLSPLLQKLQFQLLTTRTWFCCSHMQSAFKSAFTCSLKCNDFLLSNFSWNGCKNNNNPTPFP